jgi:hypothetical protein
VKGEEKAQAPQTSLGFLAGNETFDSKIESIISILNPLFKESGTPFQKNCPASSSKRVAAAKLEQWF